LLGHTFEGAGSAIVAWLSSNRNAPWLLGMFELPVAAPGGHQYPARQLQLLDHLADLHTTSLVGPKVQVLPCERGPGIRAITALREGGPAMKVLLTGSAGQLDQALCQQLPETDFVVNG
jgi:hypothetical protein